MNKCDKENVKETERITLPLSEIFNHDGKDHYVTI